jgi:hypothetical protein
VADPIGVVRGIYREFDLCWPDGFEANLKKYTADNLRGLHSPLVYAADYGLTERKIAEQAEPGMIIPGNAFRKSTK